MFSQSEYRQYSKHVRASERRFTSVKGAWTVHACLHVRSLGGNLDRKQVVDGLRLFLFKLFKNEKKFVTFYLKPSSVSFQSKLQSIVEHMALTPLHGA